MGQQTSRDPAVVNEGKGRVALNLTHQGLKKFPVERVMNTNICQQVTKIDIGHNEIADLDFIRLFPVLEDLYLDGNHITHTTIFPGHKSLRSISLNNNNIGSDGKGGTMCVERIAKAYPQLTFLSLLHNPGCPSYFTGDSQAETEAFRSFCIVKLPKLKFMDSLPIPDDEREEAEEDMEDFAVAPVSPKMSRKKSSRSIREQEKREEKLQKEQRREERAAEKAEREKERQRQKDIIEKGDPLVKESYCNRCRAKQVIELTHEGSTQHCPRCFLPFVVSGAETLTPPTPPVIPPPPLRA